VLGAVNLAFDNPHAFSDVELELMDVIGGESGQAIVLGHRVHEQLCARSPRAFAER